MRKAARTVKPNARTGERHTWKDRERRRKEERQRMAAEALIVEDAYQRGYADAIADMRKKKEQRRQREQAKKARRWYFIKQKAYGLAMLAVTVLAVWATAGRGVEYKAFEMYFMQGMDYAEIAEELDTGKNTPRRWVTGIINELSVLLWGIDEERVK